MHFFTAALACVFFFVVADLVYAIDHYLVHHDRQRYRVTHGRHHRRYNGKKDAAQLDAYELSTYGSAAVMSIAITSVVSLMTGNPGFLIGAVLKFVHTLVFHVYQHGWWSDVPLRQLQLGKPRRSWLIASAKYHAFHHSNPDDQVFTYAESFAVFDRILELLHPYIVRFTVDGAAQLRSRAAASAKPATSAERSSIENVDSVESAQP